ncbi:vomeronasal type-2 receptor 26-like [Protopterus annectens]|uniref:vomeronasal type-2 receptor 26-like n=1 Tax=Protopterus annectens TaxID=7888 RepID=UPI001CFB6571|nr:vomeronasal type-2 receptor 26-like [Protopterus annectens]
MYSPLFGKGGSTEIKQILTQVEYDTAFIHTYSTISMEIEKIIKKHWGIFKVNEETKRFIPDTPKFIRRRDTNLKEIFERADTGNDRIKNKKLGTFKWGTYNQCSYTILSFQYAKLTVSLEMKIYHLLHFCIPSQPPQSVCSEPCASGYRKATRPGQPVCCFDCIPCSKGEITNETDTSDCMKCSEELWSDEKREKCIPKMTEFLSFEENLGSVLTSLSVSASLLATCILYIFVKFQYTPIYTPIVRANNRAISYLLLTALQLCFLSSLIFIGQPVKSSCLLRQVSFGIIFSICVSAVLSKTIIVIIAFNARMPSSKLRNWVGSRWVPISIVAYGSLFQVIICSVWLTIGSPFPQKDMNSEEGKIIYKCNEGSIVMFYVMLGYLGLLASICFLCAFLARNLPDRFNEAKHITFSMLVFLTVWLSFIPAYMSAKGKYMVAVEIFAILASSTGLITCIFIPKCYIILVRPDMNTREKLTDKQ